MAQVKMMVGEQDDPEVLVGKCCDNPTGLLVRVNGTWWLVRDKATSNGQLATSAFKITICRGCYKRLTDATPTEPWAWDGKDEQLSEHLRTLGRQS